MRQGLSAKFFNNESAETRGTELEKAYAKLLGGRIVGGEGDGGVDIVFDDEPGVSLIQVKNSWDIARDFFKTSLKKREFIPIVIGDPGQYPKKEIFQSIIENGGWVGIDIPNREQMILGIKEVRNMILGNGGYQKEFFDGDISSV